MAFETWWLDLVKLLFACYAFLRQAEQQARRQGGVVKLEWWGQDISQDSWRGQTTQQWILRTGQDGWTQWPWASISIFDPWRSPSVSSDEVTFHVTVNIWGAALPRVIHQVQRASVTASNYMCGSKTKYPIIPIPRGPTVYSATYCQ